MNTLESIAAKIWEISLGASWAMLLALPFLLLFRKPGFAPIRYVIGLLLIVRLLFPFSFESELSVQNYVPQPAVATEIVYEAPSIATETAPEPISILPLLWLAGVVVLASRVFMQQVRVRRWIKAGREVSLPALEDARRLMPVRRRIGVHIVPQITTPALTGLFRPKLLLPAAALENVNLRMVFLHELAHVRRWDILVKWAAIAARTLHWFNPLVWLLTRRLGADQELLADAAALRALGAEEQKAYGETLLALASDSKPAAATMLPISGNFKQMRERIAMITHFKPATRRTFVLATVFAAAFSFLAFTRAVEKDPPSAAKPETPKAASSEKTVAALREEFERLTARIAAREEELDAYRDKLGITGPLPNEDAFPAGDSVPRLEDRRMQLQQELFALRAKLKSFERRSTSRKTASWLANDDPHLSAMYKDYDEIEKQLTVMSFNNAAEHPEVKMLTALLKRTEEKISTRFEGLQTGIKLQVATLEEQFKHIEEQIVKARVKDSEARRAARPYFNLKRDIETMRKVRDSLHARLLQEEIEARVAKASN